MWKRTLSSSGSLAGQSSLKVCQFFSSREQPSYFHGIVLSSSSTGDKSQMKRYTQWGARLFFSCTVAFSVPAILGSGGLFSIRPFWKGLALTFAAVVGKLAVGLFAGRPLTFLGFSKLGWAMNGRGEFSFFIAQEASEEDILTAEDYSAVVWALLLSSLAAPIAFRRILEADRQMIHESNVESAADAHRADLREGRLEMDSLAERQ